MESQIDNELAAIGKRLHQLRKHRNLTQLDHGKKNIEVITLIKFSLALKVKLMEIFNYDGKLPK
jgi:transcriptional regulator with XRE-family HTH domain